MCERKVVALGRASSGSPRVAEFSREVCSCCGSWKGIVPDAHSTAETSIQRTVAVVCLRVPC